MIHFALSTEHCLIVLRGCGAVQTKADASAGGGIKKLAPIVLAISHILGCLWWYIGSVQLIDSEEYNPKDLESHWIGHYPAYGTTNILQGASVFQQYVLSFYWATASLSTNGQIGEANPQTFSEMLFACIIMLTSMTVYVYILGELSNHVMYQDEKLVATRRQVALRMRTLLNGFFFNNDW